MYKQANKQANKQAKKCDECGRPAVATLKDGEAVVGTFCADHEAMFVRAYRNERRTPRPTVRRVTT